MLKIVKDFFINLTGIIFNTLYMYMQFSYWNLRFPIGFLNLMDVNYKSYKNLNFYNYKF